MRWIYVLFWTVVLGMLFLQLNNHNNTLTEEAIHKAPTQQHFYFFHGQATDTQDAPPKPDGADVEQVNFTYDNGVPNPESITCHVTLKNMGNQKATNVQVVVAPYKGALIGNDEQGDRTRVRNLGDNDPVAQYTQTVDFPDLAPGEVQTRDAVFYARQGYTPGDNVRPQITFQTEKPKPVINKAPVLPPTL
jgi:hypothetical protein